MSLCFHYILQHLEARVVHFLKDGMALLPLTIKGLEVERVNSLKFLGTTTSSSLKWDDKSICFKKKKKAHQKHFFLCQFERMLQFYRAVIENVFIFSIQYLCGMATPQLSRGSSWTELFAPPQKSSAANSPPSLTSIRPAFSEKI